MVVVVWVEKGVLKAGEKPRLVRLPVPKQQQQQQQGEAQQEQAEERQVVMVVERMPWHLTQRRWTVRQHMQQQQRRQMQLLQQMLPVVQQVRSSTRAHTHTHVDLMQACMDVCTNTHTNTHIHTHTCIHTHARAYTHLVVGAGGAAYMDVDRPLQGKAALEGRSVGAGQVGSQAGVTDGGKIGGQQQQQQDQLQPNHHQQQQQQQDQCKGCEKGDLRKADGSSRVAVMQVRGQTIVCTHTYTHVHTHVHTHTRTHTHTHIHTHAVRGRGLHPVIVTERNKAAVSGAE